MKKVVISTIFIVILAFVVFQYWQYRQPPLSCGGDWSYIVRCPLGTYCKSLEQGRLAGGLCQPYLHSLFNFFAGKF